MTRINSGINPQDLMGKHLIAEHREIKRIPNAIATGRFSMNGQPDHFVMGTGHVKFFYDKCLYLLNRYCDIYNECIKRGYKVTSYHSAWDDVPENHMNDWVETDEARKLIIERIERNENYNRIGAERFRFVT